jgi:hypothetical protein
MSGVPTCRNCGAGLDEVVVDLGLQPRSNDFLTPDQVPHERKYPLVVRRCAVCHLVQTDQDFPPGEVFTSGYVYFSSNSSSWVAHAARYAENVTARFGLGAGSRVVEISCSISRPRASRRSASNRPRARRRRRAPGESPRSGASSAVPRRGICWPTATPPISWPPTMFSRMFPTSSISPLASPFS